MTGTDSFTWIFLAWLLALVLALYSIWRSRAHGRKTKLIWTVIVLVLPFLGALGWAVLGRERRKPR